MQGSIKLKIYRDIISAKMHFYIGCEWFCGQTQKWIWSDFQIIFHLED